MERFPWPDSEQSSTAFRLRVTIKIVATTMTDKTALGQLLWSMSQPRTFYVLGAGVSSGLVPLTREIRAVIAEEYHSVGAYPTTAATNSPLRERLLGKPTFDENFRDWFLCNMPIGTLELLAQRALFTPNEQIVPPQYAVFDLIRRPATLFNFNLDGLAHSFCRNQHFVFQPHGRIDRLWFDEQYEEWLEATVLYNLRLPFVVPKLLPSPEPSCITETRPYIAARKLFRAAPSVVIVGYSFGRNRDGRLDDAESWEYVVDLLKMAPRPTYVLSPHPEELADLLRQRLSSRQVFGIAVRWEALAPLLMTASEPGRCIPSRWSDEQLARFMYSYSQSEDREVPWSSWLGHRSQKCYVSS